MRDKRFFPRTLSAVIALALSLNPLAQAQQPASQKPLENQSTVPQQVSPGPLEPQPTNAEPPAEPAPLPNAPSSTGHPTTVILGPDGQPVAQQPTSGQQQIPAPTPQPLGTAAAEGAATAGGAASRPAGVAIAPAKQRQVRSFLLKLGLIAASGVALGTVYALTKGSGSKPPNSSAATPPPPAP